MFTNPLDQKRGKEILSKIQELATAINELMENQENLVNGHNEHDERLDKMEARLNELALHINLK